MRLITGVVSLAISINAFSQPAAPPLNQDNLPLPIIVDPSQGDVPITLDGETLNVSGSVNASISEPLEVEGSVEAVLDEPIEVYGTVDVTPSSGVPVTHLRNRFFDLFAFDSDGRLSLDVPPPNYLNTLNFSFYLRGNCIFSIIGFDAGVGEPSGSNPPVLLAEHFFQEAGQGHGPIWTVDFPEPVDFTEWASPMLRLYVESSDFCRTRVFLQGMTD